MKRRTAVAAGILLLAVLGGCSGRDTGGTDSPAADVQADGENSGADTGNSADSKSQESSGMADQEDPSGTDQEMFTDRDLDPSYQEEDSVLIQLNGDSAQASSDSVQISGTTVTITEEATYIISGTLEDGMIIVDVPDSAKPQLVLNGASVTSAQSAALYILEADKVFVTLAEGTENTLANGGTFTAIDDNNIDAALFSKQDLTLNGAGSLTVSSPGGHGIVCKDDLVLTGGTYTVSAASQGLDANDSIRVTGETALAVQAGKDGLHAENDEDTSLGFVYISGGSLDIEADGDGISAGGSLQIQEGSFQILAGGGSENGSKSSYNSWESFMGGGRGGQPGQAGQMEKPGQAGQMERPGRSGQAGQMEQPGQSDGTEQPSKPGGTEQPSQSDGTEQPAQAVSSEQPMQPGQEGSPETSEESETEDAVSMKGIKAAGALVISGGTFTINSADDGVHSNSRITINGGTFAIATGDDAFHADETLTVKDGTVEVMESYEGLEALYLYIQGGELTITASDDGLNAAGGKDTSGSTGGRDGMFGGGGMSSSSEGIISISGGTLYINASGDGIDANGTVEMSGGSVTVVGPTQGDTSTLDYDISATITGGTFVGTGAAGMAQTFSDSSQGVLSVNVGNQSEGTTVTITDSQGNTVASFEPELPFQVVIYSSPQLTSGETYTITAGSYSQETEAQ